MIEKINLHGRLEDKTALLNTIDFAMGSRRKAREVALQLLYMHEFSDGEFDAALAHFWRSGELDSGTTSFALRLVLGTTEHLDDIDRFITESSENWRMSRMAVVDRNIMRMAVFEFLHTPETPKKVVINEAIEIAKRFGDGESTQFINGVLDSIRKKVEGQPDD